MKTERIQGVYWILNLENGKVYVGSAVDLVRREYEHFKGLRLGNHINVHLQRAYKKSGADIFVLELLEEVEDKLWLPARETVWMKKLKSYDPEFGYNRTDHGFQMKIDQTGVKRSEACRAKLRAAWVRRKAEGDYYKFTPDQIKNARALAVVALKAKWQDPEWAEKTRKAQLAGWVKKKEKEA